MSAALDTAPEIRVEDDFNWHTRQALAEQGFRAMHIREANFPGVSDLIVYSGRDVATVEGLDQLAALIRIQVVDAWIELKIGSNWTGVRPAQREFMREHWKVGKNAIFALYDINSLDKRTGNFGAIRLMQGDENGPEAQVNLNPYKVDWQGVFEKFKKRK